MNIPFRAVGITLAASTVVGMSTGGLAARNAINQVPIQTETVEWVAPVTQSTEIGKISSDYYHSGTIRPSHDTAQTVPVRRNQPVMEHGRVFGESSSTQVKMQEHSEVREGHGEPSTTTEPRKIEGYTFNGQNRSVNEDYETRQTGTTTVYRREVVSYETRTETYTIPGPCTDVYNSDGSSSQSCAPDSTGTRTVQDPVYGDVPYEEPVYEDFLVGFNVRYSPSVSSTNLGTYDYPVTTFDHGIDVGGMVRNGGLGGFGVGMLGAGGVVLLANRKREDGEPGDDPTLHSQSIDPRWQVVTPDRVSYSDSDLDDMLGPFRWHAHCDTASGEKYWDYHRAPEGTWHEHRASVSEQLLVADRANEDLVGDNWVAYKADDFPQAYLDPKFRYYRATDPEAGDLIFFDMTSMANVMERRGGPHEPHPNIPGIADNHASVSVKHNGF